MTADLRHRPAAASHAQNAKPAIFFQDVHRAFLQAEQSVGDPIGRFYTAGGFTIHLRFAGPALVPLLTPALEHLAAEPASPPGLTICLWDSGSTGVDLPALPWEVDGDVIPGEMWRFNSKRFNMISLPANGTLNMLDRARSLAIYWFHDAHQLPWYESASPLLAILHWWMESHGCHLVHAGAVGVSKGGVLLVGKGGSGKSTTALACLSSNLAYASDDHCLISNDPFPYVYSLYSSAKVNTEDIERFPLLKPALSSASQSDGEKAFYLIYQHFREKISTGFPIRAVLIPCVTGRMETTLSPASPAEGLRALAPSTTLQLPGATRSASALRAMAELVKQTPCYYLELGADLSQIPDVILGLLSEV